MILIIPGGVRDWHSQGKAILQYTVVSMLSLISLIEMSIGIICASLPACAAVFRS